MHTQIHTVHTHSSVAARIPIVVTLTLIQRHFNSFLSSPPPHPHLNSTHLSLMSSVKKKRGIQAATEAAETEEKQSKKQHSSASAADSSSQHVTDSGEDRWAEKCMVCLTSFPLRLADGTANPIWRLPNCMHKICDGCCRELIRTKR